MSAVDLAIPATSFVDRYDREVDRVMAALGREALDRGVQVAG